MSTKNIFHANIKYLKKKKKSNTCRKNEGWGCEGWDCKIWTFKRIEEVINLAPLNSEAQKHTHIILEVQMKSVKHSVLDIVISLYNTAIMIQLTW